MSHSMSGHTVICSGSDAVALIVAEDVLVGGSTVDRVVELWLDLFSAYGVRLILLLILRTGNTGSAGFSDRAGSLHVSRLSAEVACDAGSILVDLAVLGTTSLGLGPFVLLPLGRAAWVESSLALWPACFRRVLALDALGWSVWSGPDCSDHADVSLTFLPGGSLSVVLLDLKFLIESLHSVVESAEFALLRGLPRFPAGWLSVDDALALSLDPFERVVDQAHGPTEVSVSSDEDAYAFLLGSSDVLVCELDFLGVEVEYWRVSIVDACYLQVGNLSSNFFKYGF